MKKISVLLLLLTAGFPALPTRAATLADETVVWAGLDYSMTRFVDADAFRDPAAIFPGLLDKWNSLYLKERLEPLGKILKKKVEVDIGGVMARNAKATKKQIVEFYREEDHIRKTHITEDDLKKLVKSLKMEVKEGLGLVFVMDRLVKNQKNAAMYVVFFDIKTREIVAQKRDYKGSGGFGIRNYWFSPIKRVEGGLPSLFGRKAFKR